MVKEEQQHHKESNYKLIRQLETGTANTNLY